MPYEQRGKSFWTRNHIIQQSIEFRYTAHASNVEFYVKIEVVWKISLRSKNWKLQRLEVSLENDEQTASTKAPELSSLSIIIIIESRLMENLSLENCSLSLKLPQLPEIFRPSSSTSNSYHIAQLVLRSRVVLFVWRGRQTQEFSHLTVEKRKKKSFFFLGETRTIFTPNKFLGKFYYFTFSSLFISFTRDLRLSVYSNQNKEESKKVRIKKVQWTKWKLRTNHARWRRGGATSKNEREIES